jgi:thiol-disulfide isomerase/thioredoxin
VLGAAAAAAAASNGDAGPPVGSLAPDFSARDLVNGEKVHLGDDRGKVVILTFWATWCKPCREELPVLENAESLLGRDRLLVYAVPFDEPPEAMGLLKKAAANWKISLISDGWGSIARHYAIRAIPHLFLIGRDGRIVANHLGYGPGGLQELVDDINAAFRDTPTAAPVTVPVPATAPAHQR